MKRSLPGSKSVYVIIVNFNHLDDLKETIVSILNQDYPNIKLIISDNASVDNSVSWVSNNFPEIVVIENKVNLGWDAGNNIGIIQALKENADYVLLSNNDIYLDNPGILSQMVSDLEKS